MDDNENRWGKRQIGKTADFGGGLPEAEPGFAVWVENGTACTAPIIDPEKFGGHDYHNGGYEKGIRDCRCGAFMLSSSSGGPVNPFGPCPLNPLITTPKTYDIKALSLNLDDHKQNFVGTATIRAAFCDVIDSLDGLNMWAGEYDGYIVTEDDANAAREKLISRVIDRISDLQSIPHEGIRLENLCPRHIRAVLPRPTSTTCSECAALEREEANDTADFMLRWELSEFGRCNCGGPRPELNRPRIDEHINTCAYRQYFEEEIEC